MTVQAESFRLNGHIIGFRPQTQKLESPHKTLSSTLAVKGLNGIRTHGRYISAAVLYHLSYEDPYIRSRPIFGVHLNPAVKGMTLEDDVSCGNTNFK